MPRQATIAILQDNTITEAPKATAAERPDTLDEAVTVQTAIEEAGKDSNRDSDECGSTDNDIQLEILNIQLDFQGLMDAPLLCEVVSLMWADEAQEKYLRAQRVAALRARWLGRSYNTLPWLPRPHVSTAGQC